MTQETTIAWAGWRVRVPEDWRPLKLEGGWAKGSLMLGREGSPFVLIKWWRPEQKSFDAERWMKRRFKSLGALPEPDAPAPTGFSPAGWVADLQRLESDGKTVSNQKLTAMPVHDGMSAAMGRLFISFRDGTVQCWGQ